MGMTYCVLTMVHPVVDLTLRSAGVARIITVRRGFGVVLLFKVLGVLLRDRGAIFNFHYPNYRYVLAVGLLRLLGRKYTVCLWGSDYLKVVGWRAQILSFIASGAEKITIASPLAAKRFCKRFKIPTKNMLVMPFMIPNIDELYSVSKVCRSFSNKRIKVLCGTNGSENQQFDIILHALHMIEDKAYDKLEINFHLAYGVAENVLRMIAEFQGATRYSVVIKRDFLAGRELIDYRMSMDVLIQIQKTDQLSAAMLEHLVQGKPVITGAWLEYSVLDELGVEVEKVDEARPSESLAEKLEKILSDSVVHGPDSNGEKIINFFGAAVSLARWKNFLLKDGV